MKRKLPLKYSMVLLIGFIGFSSIAKDQDEKKKVIEKSYPISENTTLSIENKFGKVAINSWDKYEFQVTVEVIAKGKNEERAQRILDEIFIDIDQSSSEISFQTDISNIKNKNNEGFEVNYKVYMPEKNPLTIRNSFGDVTMANRKGELNLYVSYGSMKVGDVSAYSKIKLSFGSGSLGELDTSDILVKYSNLEIEKAKTLELEQGFSDIEIDEVTDLELESKYGKVEIEKAHKIDAEASFSGFEIEELTGSLELDCSYLGDFKIDRLAKSFTLVDIDGKFGSYNISIEPGLNANIDAEFSFADLKYSSDVNADFNYQVKESNKSYYKGKIGTGDPNKIIRIDSGYGNLRLSVD